MVISESGENGGDTDRPGEIAEMRRAGAAVPASPAGGIAARIE